MSGHDKMVSTRYHKTAGWLQLTHQATYHLSQRERVSTVLIFCGLTVVTFCGLTVVTSVI